MAHSSTVLSQMLKIVPRHEFNTLAEQHHSGRKLRKMTRWSQFVAMASAQLSGRVSLRDLVHNLDAQISKLFHLGLRRVTRSSLARVNEKQPHELYEALFRKLLARCQKLAPGHGFRFKNKLYSLDATTIDLCLKVFPWAHSQQSKGAIKLHVGLDHAGMLPEFVAITDGKTHDITAGRALQLQKGSMVVFDKAYIDYQWFNSLNERDISFVTRQKRNARYEVVERRSVAKKQGLTSDQTIHMNGSKSARCTIALRRIGYRDPETGKHFVFLTNNFKLAASTIAQIYKARWQVELFFKWIKQNLKIKAFMGTTKNAVMTQIWVAMCVYLLLAYLKFLSKSALSLQQIIRLLQLNLFERRSLQDLLAPSPPAEKLPGPQQSLMLA
ncbi:MAG: IS4 family transposase [Xanthomonadales bacterium]|nr:IS4 family transposase [Xanthomonadales bacterium]MBL38396.1 IS4 family transposase [Xanthomonadales bacterium]